MSRSGIQALAPHRTPWAYETEPFEMVQGVYYVGNKSVSSHLFDTGEGLLLLDTTYGETAYLLLNSIRKLGFDPMDIRWIVHTHAHIDHFGATRMLTEMTGCTTYMPAADLPFMKSADWTYCETLGIRYEPPYDAYFETDVPVHPGDVFRFGNITMTAYAAPGHTPGTMAYVFELPSGLRAAMHGGTGLNTLTSAYSRVHNLGTAWRDDYRNTLDRLSGLEVDVVLGNHPYQTNTFEKKEARTEGRNPFVDSSEWGRFLSKCRAKFEKMLIDDPT
ncbi:MAG: MBL fold metallo-hydrolase [Clostridia bacterium]|nr:MBL fold metallo-hydrolase [Clostridia bacterium]